MLLSDLDFDLPPELIAQSPANPRESARLLVLDRMTGQTRQATMGDFPALLRPDDLLVFNDSRVLRARLRGRRASGGRVEALLLEEQRPNMWRALLKPSARLKVGESVLFGGEAPVDARLEEGGSPAAAKFEETGAGLPLSSNPQTAALALEGRLTERDGEAWVLEFQTERDARELLPLIGEVPLPPYIHATGSDENYQTSYARADARIEGRAFDSAAAPTAGLHFTPELLARLAASGIERAFVTLAVGTGTFAPIKVENLDAHRMHAERFHIAPEVAERINSHRQRGGRVVAIGTTTVRTLESAASETGQVQGGWGETRLFLRPGARFRVVDALLTNFHLPRSTLLALVAAFADAGSVQTKDYELLNGENGSNSRGLTLVRAAYREAIENRFRFFSWGDALFIE